MSTTSAGEAQKPPVSVEERARLRRNQRNSRARKQAYLEDLERRWSDCVAQGAQASTELQQEARRVLDENRKLRLMLHELGVDQASIQQRLSSNTNAESIMSSATSPQSLSARSGTVPELAPAIMPEAMQNTHQLQSLWPLQNIESYAFDASNDTRNTTVMDSSAATMHEWDLYHWLQDLTDLKDAFGSEITSFAKPDEQIDFNDMQLAESTNLALQHESNVPSNTYYAPEQQTAALFQPAFDAREASNRHVR